MNPKARRAAILSVVFVVGMFLYVMLVGGVHRAWMHRRAIGSQRHYALHDRDSPLATVEFKALPQPATVLDTPFLKTFGPFAIEYFVGAGADRRLAARVTGSPLGETRSLARAEIYMTPTLKLTGARAYPIADSIWRKTYYTSRVQDSVWKKVSVHDFPDRKDPLHTQVESDSL